MKKRGPVTAFYIETLLMIVVFIGIILVLSRVFAVSRQKSVRAESLTTAVCLAENAAEAFYAARTPDELYSLLNYTGKEDVSGSLKGNDASFTAVYNERMEPDEAGAFRLEMNWQTDSEGFSSGNVTVQYMQESIYFLPLSAAGKEGFKR